MLTFVKRNSILLILTLGSIGFAEPMKYSLVRQEETRIKLGIVDTGYTPNQGLEPFLCKDSHFDFTRTGITDTDGHGTNLAHIAAQYLDKNKHCIVIIKAFDPRTRIVKVIEAIKYIADFLQVDYLNLSYGGPDSSGEEKIAMMRIISSGTTISVAAGNSSQELTMKCNYYPACYNIMDLKFHVVGNGRSARIRHPSSNYGLPVTHWEFGWEICTNNIGNNTRCMTGTSQSSILHLSKTVVKEHP